MLIDILTNHLEFIERLVNHIFFVVWFNRCINVLPEFKTYADLLARDAGPSFHVVNVDRQNRLLPPPPLLTNVIEGVTRAFLEVVGAYVLFFLKITDGHYQSLSHAC